MLSPYWKGGRGLAWTAAAALIGLYFLFFFKSAVDIPFGDDYAPLGFVVNFTNPEWGVGKASQILDQHNEHRIATLRLTLLLWYALRHEVNFILIAFLGNAAVVGIALLLARRLKTSAGGAGGPPSWAFLPVFFLLFQPQHFQLMLWALCTYTNVVVVLLAFLSLYLLTRKRTGKSASWAFASAAVLAVIASYTNGNGLFVFLAGVVVLLVGKDFRRLAPWILIGGLTAFFYFQGYVRNPAHPDIWPYLKEHFFGVVEYFLAVTGAWADFGVLRPFASVAAGILVMAGFVGLTVRGLFRKSPFVSAAALFVLISLGALTWTRAPFTVLQSYEPRYKFTAVVLLVLLYLGGLAVAREKKRKAVAAGFLVFSVIFGGLSYAHNIPKLRAYGPVLADNLIRWNAWRADLPFASPEQAEEILRLTVQRKIYQPPPRLGILRPVYPFGFIDPAGGTAAAPSADGEVVVSGWALDNGGPPRIIVRRSPLPGDPESVLNRKKLVYVGQTRCAAGTVPNVARVYYGFPGRETMLWTYRFRPADYAGSPEPPTLYFFARDRAGRENLLGTIR